MKEQATLETQCINTIRFLAVDAIEKAKSGHPGMPMGAAAAAYTLWTRHLRHNPADPLWWNRDRFVLSAGHASMLLYALLHLTSYDLSLDDLRSFRQWESKTPGHPEHRHPVGTEMTTGPLGQGFAAAVGMAAAEAHLGARFNRPDFELFDHFTYVLASDGDLMEGVCTEAASLAGHLGLGRLICLYDDNRVCLSGDTALAFSEDIAGRFSAAGWQILTVTDGNDVTALDLALTEAKAETERPSLIRFCTTIGYGAPAKQGSSAAHGSPLGPEEAKAAKAALGWPLEPAFLVPDEVRAVFRESGKKGAERQAKWQEILARYGDAYPPEAAELKRIMAGELPDGWETSLSACGPETKEAATRKTSEACLQILAKALPELVGGSADLNPSTFTWLKDEGDFQKPKTLPVCRPEGAVGGEWGYAGRNIHFGVREHAMAAIAGGLALHGGILPFTGTFFTFVDYMRPAIRLAALMRLKVIYVFTHDSIGVGEDGPTHQPIEQLMSLRVIPGLTVIRPADANETVEAWRCAVASGGPTALVLTRQNLPVLDRSVVRPAEGLHQGGYVLWESGGEPEAILISTGSEVAVALQAAQTLAASGIRSRCISLPSWEVFDAQPRAYREQVLPPSCRIRVAIEAGTSLGWEHYCGLDGVVLGIDRFGASAPYQEIFRRFRLTAEAAVAAVRRLLGR
ncbi:MAG: transketolase [Syntrophaceae bacterium]|nr:transketolase [Syntrophaceae bacterium]